jgi:hypothetical protein
MHDHVNMVVASLLNTILQVKINQEIPPTNLSNSSFVVGSLHFFLTTNENHFPKVDIKMFNHNDVLTWVSQLEQ